MLTANIDVDRSIVAFRKEDGKTELTIFTTPLSTVEATPAIHLIPSPGVSDETALKQTAEIITSLTDSNRYISIDLSDVISICASEAIRIIWFNAGDDPGKAFSDQLAAQGIEPSCCDGALISIELPPILVWPKSPHWSQSCRKQSKTMPLSSGVCHWTRNKKTQKSPSSSQNPKERRRRTKTEPHPVCWANNIQQSGCGSKPPNELSIIIY